MGHYIVHVALILQFSLLFQMDSLRPQQVPSLVVEVRMVDIKHLRRNKFYCVSKIKALC